MSPQDIVRQLDGIARRDPRGEVIAACRRSALLSRAGRPGAQTAVLSELQQLAVAEVARPALQGVLRWARGEAPYMNRALNVPK